MKRQKRTYTSPTLHFRIWKRAGYAIMASLGKVVNISRLKVSMCASEEAKSNRNEKSELYFCTAEKEYSDECPTPIMSVTDILMPFIEEKKVISAYPAEGLGKIYLFKTSAFFTLKRVKNAFKF